VPAGPRTPLAVPARAARSRSARAIYVTVHPASVLARNLQSNDRIAVSVCDNRHAIMTQGRAVRIGPDRARST